MQLENLGLWERGRGGGGGVGEGTGNIYRFYLTVARLLSQSG